MKFPLLGWGKSTKYRYLCTHFVVGDKCIACLKTVTEILRENHETH